MEPVRVDLKGALAGHYILVDTDAVTVGTYEDLQGPTVSIMLDTIAGLIAGGDLPHGTARAELRKLKPLEFKAVTDGMREALEIPKVS